MKRLAAVVAVLLSAAACGDGGGSSIAESPSRAGQQSVTLTCLPGHGLDFAPEALEGPANAEASDDPAAQALREYAAKPTEGMPAHPSGWRELSRTGDAVLFAHGQDLQYVKFERDGDRWKWAASGGACTPLVVVPDGQSPAGWQLKERVDRGATSFTAAVTEMACASGASADGRVLEPSVEYRQLEIIVRFAVRRLPGDHNCPGNLSSDYVVELAEPVGDRRLLDGSVYPPRPVTIAESPDTQNQVTVTLWHCGVDPLQHAGTLWEVNDPPFDATNAPMTFSGTGTVAVVGDRLRYTDEKGAVLAFTRDDGVPPPACA